MPTLDTADLSRLSPFSFAHVYFGVINPKCLYINNDVAQLRFRLGHLLND